MRLCASASAAGGCTRQRQQRHILTLPSPCFIAVAVHPRLQVLQPALARTPTAAAAAPAPSGQHPAAGSMAAALRAARQGLRALSRTPALAAQQQAGFTSLTLGSWWQGTGSPAAANAAALGWQRVTALLPSLEDMQLLAAPKKKVRLCGFPDQPVLIKGNTCICSTSLLHRACADCGCCLYHLQVSPHRKGKRSANKFIRFVPVVAQCSQVRRGKIRRGRELQPGVAAHSLQPCFCPALPCIASACSAAAHQSSSPAFSRRPAPHAAACHPATPSSAVWPRVPAALHAQQVRGRRVPSGELPAEPGNRMARWHGMALQQQGVCCKSRCGCCAGVYLEGTAGSLPSLLHCCAPPMACSSTFGSGPTPLSRYSALGALGRQRASRDRPCLHGPAEPHWPANCLAPRYSRPACCLVLVN